MRGVRALDPGADRSRDAQGAAAAAGADCNARSVEDERVSLVGWAKALAGALYTAMPIVRRAHHRHQRELRHRWWARRTRGCAGTKGRARAFAHPTRKPLRLPLRHA